MFSHTNRNPPFMSMLSSEIFTSLFTVEFDTTNHGQHHCFLLLTHLVFHQGCISWQFGVRSPLRPAHSHHSTPFLHMTDAKLALSGPDSSACRRLPKSLSTLKACSGIVMQKLAFYFQLDICSACVRECWLQFGGTVGHVTPLAAATADSSRHITKASSRPASQMTKSVAALRVRKQPSNRLKTHPDKEHMSTASNCDFFWTENKSCTD